ncbi:MAG: Uridine kinaselike protein [Acidimicrobiales bacterium]|nr:Uridine kinaselike protein [Acidimicrobiales bacterium]
MRLPPDPRPITAEVVLLAGPSGCGKTHLARAVGLPIVALDDFYRDGTDPGMPRTAEGVVDWEDPASWDPDRAVAALAELCRADHVEVPTYLFGEDRVVGRRTLARDGRPIVVAEGIFAAELVGPLRDAGLLADALLVRQARWLTFARRLVRDLREGRKAPWYLVRQGWSKTRNEPAVVAHQRARGARPVTKAQARARLTGLATRPVLAIHQGETAVGPAAGAA